MDGANIVCEYYIKAVELTLIGQILYFFGLLPPSVLLSHVPTIDGAAVFKHTALDILPEKLIQVPKYSGLRMFTKLQWVDDPTGVSSPILSPNFHTSSSLFSEGYIAYHDDYFLIDSVLDYVKAVVLNRFAQIVNFTYYWIRPILVLILWPFWVLLPRVRTFDLTSVLQYGESIFMVFLSYWLNIMDKNIGKTK